MYPEIPALSFFSAVLSLVPVVGYLRARNIAAVAIGGWLSVTNLIYAIDAVVWAESADAKGSVWCDISTTFITGSRIALPAACLSICIHLERLASFCQISVPQMQRRRIIFECLMCFVLPLLYVALHLIVQPRRFDLFYGYGCRPATYPTIATVFLIMIPPHLLTIATIVCAGIAGRHFLVHGVQFYGKRGSISSLTRNLYLRLIGMALFEAVLSAVLVAIVMWGVLSSGLAPIGNMSRDLSEVRVWDTKTTTRTVRTVLQVEWLVTVLQSIVFFALFACQMGVLHEAWGLIRSLLQLLRELHPSAILEQAKTSEQSSASSISVPTLSLTEVDLSLVIQSASMLTPYGQSMDMLSSSLDPSRRPSLTEDASQHVVASTIDLSMFPLESPSRASAIASSHNSLESNFDPSWLQDILSPDAWPPTPIPAAPYHTIRVGHNPGRLEESWLDVDVPFPRAKVAAHVKLRTVDLLRQPLGYDEPEKHHAIYMAVVREMH